MKEVEVTFQEQIFTKSGKVSLNGILVEVENIGTTNFDLGLSTFRPRDTGSFGLSFLKTIVKKELNISFSNDNSTGNKCLVRTYYEVR